MAFLKYLEIFNFRNIAELKIEVDSDFLCFYGDNAQGKTNILESIYLLSNIKSFRYGSVSDWIKHNTNKSQVKALIKDEYGKYNLSYCIGDKKRQFFKNKNKLKGIKDVIKDLKIVSYSPASYQIIIGEEAEKRSFFDKLAFNIDTSHLENLVYYNKALKNRNQSLKNKKNVDMWNDILIDKGIKISKKRIQAANYLEQYLQETFKIFFNDVSDLKIKINTNVICNEKEYLKKLIETTKIDEIKGYTSIGPQRDIFDINIDGINVKKIISTGQAKLLAFLFKIAKCRLINKHCSSKPIFLYDDASIFLDENRFFKLIDIIKKEDIQIISTSVDKGLFSRLFSDTVQLINIDKGSTLK